MKGLGYNSYGQLGNGTTTNSSVPVQVSNLTAVVAVAGGEEHSLALDSNGSVWAWGVNNYGQLGNGTTTDSSVPVQVSNLTAVVAVAGGGAHSLALDSNDSVWAWGDNSSGQLGNGTTTNSSVPVRVSNLKGVVAVAGGGAHSLALDSNGSVWAWGYNRWGQLGNGTTTDSSVPVQVSNLTAVVTVAGGGAHSLAVVAPSDFTVSASPTSLTLAQGGSGLVTLTTTVSGGFNSPVSLSASGLPTGVSATFNPASIAAPGSGTSQITLSADSSAATGTYAITLSAAGGGRTHSVPVSLTIVPLPNFALSASPTSVSVAQGSSGLVTLTTTVSGGFDSPVRLSASGLPCGVRATFRPASIAAPGSGTSLLTLTASSHAETGTYSVRVSATGGGKTHTASVSLIIVRPPDFTLYASPKSLSVARGGSGSVTLTTAISGGFNSAVSLSASGLPIGVNASFSPATIASPGSGTSLLRLTASSKAATGIYAIKVSASGGGKTRTDLVLLRVVRRPNITITEIAPNAKSSELR